jgi:hypothetical protein
VLLLLLHVLQVPVLLLQQLPNTPPFLLLLLCCIHLLLLWWRRLWRWQQQQCYSQALLLLLLLLLLCQMPLLQQQLLHQLHCQPHLQSCTSLLPTPPEHALLLPLLLQDHHLQLPAKLQLQLTHLHPHNLVLLHACARLLQHLLLLAMHLLLQHIALHALLRQFPLQL